MATTVGEVNIDIRAKTDGLEGDINKGKSIVDRGMQDIRGMASAAQAALAAIGGASMIGFINSVIESAAGLQQMSEQSGVSVEALSALRSVAKLSGTDMQDVVTSLQKLSKSMVASKDATSEQAEVFKMLGVNVKDASGKLKTADQVMLEVALAQAKFKDGAEKTAAMMVIFGKAGANLGPVLKDLAEKGSLNGKVTTEQAEAADKFEKQLVILKTGMEGFLRGAILPLLPYLSTLGPLLKDAAILTAAYFAVFTGVPAIMGGVTAVLAGLGPTIGALTVEVGLFKAATLSAFGLIAAAFAGWEIGSWLVANFLEAKLAGIAFVEGLMVGWETLKYGAEVAWLGIKTAFNTAIEAIGEVFATELEIIAKGMAMVGAGSAADGIKDFAASIRSATATTTTFAEEQAKLKDQYDKNVDAVRAITGDMADEAIAQDALKRAAKGTEDALKDLTGTKAKLTKETKNAIKAAEEYEASLLVQNQQLELEESMGRKLTDAEKALIQLTSDLANGKKIMSKETEEFVRWLIQENAGLADNAKWMEADRKENEAAADAVYKQTQSLIDQTKGLRESTAEMGLSADALAALRQQRLLDKAAVLEQRAAILEAGGPVTEMSQQLRDQAVAVRELADAMNANEWAKTTKQIGDGLSSALIDGIRAGKDLWTSFRDWMANSLINGPLKNAFSSLIQSGLNAVTGGGGGGGSGSGMSSVLGSGASNILGSITIAGSSLAAIGSSVMTGVQAGWAGTSIAEAASAYSAAGMTGVSTGLSVGSSIGSAAAGVSSAITSTLAAIPVWGWIAMALATQLGGPQIDKEGSGLQGTLSSSGASGLQNTTMYKEDHHGLFGMGAFTTHNTEYSDAGSAVTNLLSDAVKTITATNAAYARMLGLNSAALDNFTMQLSVNTTGLDDAAVQAAIGAELTKFSAAQLTAAYGDAVAAFAHAGETVADTMHRLIATQQASEVLNAFGGIFSKIASSSLEARDSMISLAGGIDALIAKSAAFVQSYYSADEQSGMSAKAVLAQLSAAGVTNAGALDSKADFRTLVESIDVTNAAGRAQVNTLLDIAPQFAQLATTLEGQHLTLTDLAALAPQIAALTPLFTTAADNAAAATVSAADATTAAINTTTSAVQAGTNAVVAAVNGLAGTVAGAVAGAAAASNAAVSAMSSRLDTLDANARLARADTAEINL
jgi:hypothetical protein